MGSSPTCWRCPSPASGACPFSSRRADRFAGQEWLRRAGQDKSLAWATAAEEDSRLDCADADCRYRLEDRVVAIVSTPTGLTEACAESDLVVSLVPAAGACRVP